MPPATDRRIVALACTLFMAMLGTVYAWSFFQKPLGDAFLWTNSQVAWAFSASICCLGLAAAAGGNMVRRFGPTRLALAGGLMHGLGYLLAAAALKLHSLPLLYLGYGILGGSGLGLGYVTPVATIVRWFPDRKGLATGMVVMGFGFGALIMSKILAPLLLSWCSGNLVAVFASIGVVFMTVTLLLARFIANPPDDWCPAGFTEAADSASSEPGDSSSLKNALLSRQFLLMWSMFFCNITAGIAIIGFQSPLFQEICKAANPGLDAAKLSGYGASLIAASSLFNGIGRLFWGALSDRIGRRETFSLLLATQLVVFFLMILTDSPWLFAILVCYVLLCYGGGFGTMPSFVLDVFGNRLMPAVYGAVLTAWSAAGIVGPQIVAILKDIYPAKTYPARAATLSFTMGAALLAIGLILSLLCKNSGARTQGQ